MSRLSDLLAQVARLDPQLGADLGREVKALAGRRQFGLNFERHQPESVEMPGRPVRRGDKVRVLPPRGSAPRGDDQLWFVQRVGDGTAQLVELGAEDPNRLSHPVADLVVVAEFRDPIYPGLVSTGKVERGGDKPFHTVINAENFHALEALLYTHEGKVDAIYIDPPYNTGARDWKYNNDYVDSDDAYRHSKWLAFMERRLKLAKRLLNPDNSVLVVTIDEKEYLRLGLLLQQVYPEASQQMVSSVINPAGTGRKNEFSRTNEFIYFLKFGAATLDPMNPRVASSVPVEWEPLRRRDLTSRRGSRPRQFFPIYVDQAAGRIAGTGEPLRHTDDRGEAPAVPGCAAVFPIREDGTEMTWSLTRHEVERRYAKGYVRIGRHQPDGPQEYVITYLRSGPIADIETGRAVVDGYAADGSVVARYPSGKRRMPLTQWDIAAHDAQRYGTTLIQSLIPSRRFPFPKSLFAVEDALRIGIADKNDAVVLDFFSGSGTTAHAVMRLNKQDGGRRQCISVTNNEVAADEQKALRAKGLRPGDPEWEQWGICDYITKPRIEAAITGRTPSGDPIKGDYKFTDEFPMADGFEENAEFFTLTYEAPRTVAHHRSFDAIAPLLWLRAGARGRRIEKPTDTFDISETYGVLFNVDAASDFIRSLGKGARIAFIVTDDERAFQLVCGELPETVEPVRLYESYLTSFQIGIES